MSARSIIDLLATDKSQYFSQPRPIIVDYFPQFVPHTDICTYYYNGYGLPTQAILVLRPFPSSLVPLFQSESKCETFLMKMTLICMKIILLHAQLIFI